MEYTHDVCIYYYTYFIGHISLNVLPTLTLCKLRQRYCKQDTAILHFEVKLYISLWIMKEIHYGLYWIIHEYTLLFDVRFVFVWLFYAFESLLCSARLYLLDQKYSKNSNNVKCRYNLK